MDEFFCFRDMPRLKRDFDIEEETKLQIEEDRKAKEIADKISKKTQEIELGLEDKIVETVSGLLS